LSLKGRREEKKRPTLFTALSVEADDAALGVAAVVDVRETERLKVIFEIVVFLIRVSALPSDWRD
jgi:hypothetical protein